MTDPADETGLCLTSLHEFPADSWNTVGLAVSEDEAYVYLCSESVVGAIARVDTATWTLTDPWVTVPDGTEGMAIGPDGTLYVLYDDGNVATVAPDGTVTAGFATLPTGWFWFETASIGGDGLLYAPVVDDSGFVSVISVDLTTGAVTDITGLHLTDASLFYDYCTADGDGNVWAVFRGTVGQTSTILRKWDGTTVTDHAIQDVQEPYYDGDSNATHNLLCDASGKLILPMVTHQAGMHTYEGARFFNEMFRTSDFGSPSFVTPTNCSIVGGGTTVLNITPDAGASSFSIAIISEGQDTFWDPKYRGSHARAGIRRGSVLTDAHLQLQLREGSAGGTVLADSGLSTTSVSISYSIDTAPIPASIYYVLTVTKDSGTWLGTENYTFENAQLDFEQPAPALMWFLHVDAGAPTRIAGTWSYTSTPGPFLFSVDNAIVDGPLSDSLATIWRQNFGAAGMNPSRTKCYFINDAASWPGPEATPSRYSLLRRLARCPGGVAFRLRHRMAVL